MSRYRLPSSRGCRGRAGRLRLPGSSWSRRRGGGGSGPGCWTAWKLTRARLGVVTLRLDTRSDLTEARRLYARHGYREVPAFSQGPYADHWFEKTLS